MATKKNVTAEVKRGELVNAAKELNELLKLEPAINVKAKPEELTEKLLEAATLLDVEDEITKDTATTLTAIGAKLPAKPGKAEANVSKKAAAKPVGKTKIAEPSNDELTALIDGLNAIEGMVEIDAELNGAELTQAIVEAAGTLTADDAHTLTDESWAVLKMLGVKKPVAEKPVKAAAKPAGKAKAEKPKKEGKAVGPKVGVISAIFDIMKASSKKSPVSKADIIERLVKKFPDRSADSMKATVNVQIPNRMAKEKGLKIEKGEKGYYVA